MFGNESGFKANKGLLEDQKIKTVLQFTIAIHSIQTLIHSSSVFRLLSVGWKMGKIADFFFSFTNNLYWFNSLKLLKQFLPYFVIVIGRLSKSNLQQEHCTGERWSVIIFQPQKSATKKINARYNWPPQCFSKFLCNVYVLDFMLVWLHP